MPEAAKERFFWQLLLYFSACAQDPLRKIKSAAVSGLSEALFFEIVRPAAEKTRFEGAEVAGTRWQPVDFGG